MTDRITLSGDLLVVLRKTEEERVSVLPARARIECQWDHILISDGNDIVVR